MLSAREINVDTCWRYQKARDDSFHSPFHLVTQSTDIIGACAASTRFYQVTSLVTNPTIVAAIPHIRLPEKGGLWLNPASELNPDKPALEAGRTKPRSDPSNGGTK
jgi:hypothetical protein